MPKGVQIDAACAGKISRPAARLHVDQVSQKEPKAYAAVCCTARGMSNVEDPMAMIARTRIVKMRMARLGRAEDAIAEVAPADQILVCELSPIGNRKVSLWAGDDGCKERRG